MSTARLLLVAGLRMMEEVRLFWPKGKFSCGLFAS